MPPSLKRTRSKKGGSSASRSKTRRISKSTQPKTIPESALALSIGFEQHGGPSPTDEKIFRAFQSNLLSLISHELKTPILGILNALRLLEEHGVLKRLSHELGESGKLPDEGLSSGELLLMAMRGAERLSRALELLLDLASLESGSFQVLLKESSLSKALKGLSIREHELEVRFRPDSPDSNELFLIDPSRLRQAVELCLGIISRRAQPGSPIELSISGHKIRIESRTTLKMDQSWDRVWKESWLQSQSGLGSSITVFSGVLRSEQAFLSRTEEGLGAELHLVHEITKRHMAHFAYSLENERLALEIELPKLTSFDRVRLGLQARIDASQEGKSVGVILLAMGDEKNAESIRQKAESRLARPSDTIYFWPEKKWLCVLFGDWRRSDAEQWARLFVSENQDLIAGFSLAISPEDGLDALTLIDRAGSLFSGSGR